MVVLLDPRDTEWNGLASAENLERPHCRWRGFSREAQEHSAIPCLDMGETLLGHRPQGGKSKPRREVMRSTRKDSIEDRREETGVEKVVVKRVEWNDFLAVLMTAPSNSLHRGGRAIEQAVAGHDQPRISVRLREGETH